MNELLAHLPPALLRTSLLLTLSVVVVTVAMRLLKVTSPTIRRIAYVGVVLQGCLLWRGVVAMPLPFLPESLAEHLAGSSDLQTDVARNSQSSLTTGSLIESEGAQVFDSLSDNDEELSPHPTIQLVTNSEISWPRWLAIAWGGGIVFLVTHAIWNYSRSLRGLPRELEAMPEWTEEWENMQRAAGVRSPIPLYVTEESGPMLCRLPGGYRLVIPAAYWSGLQAVQRAAILRHELAHLVRGDIWKSLAIRALALPQWFNPLVWWVVRRFDDCAEWACDEAARAAVPEHVADYARALLQLGAQSKTLALTGSAASGSSLSWRIRRLLSTNSWEDSRMKKLSIIALMLGLLSFNVLKVELSAEEPANEIVSTLPAGARPVWDFARFALTESVAQAEEEELLEADGGSVLFVEFRIREATVDMAHLFKNDATFQREREALKAEIKKAEELLDPQAKEMKQIRKKIEELQKDPEKKHERELLEDNLTVQKAAYDAQRKVNGQRILRRESEINQEVYERIQAEVAAYAKEHGIRKVLRRVARPSATTATGDLLDGDTPAIGGGRTATLRFSDIGIADDDKPAMGSTAIERSSRDSSDRPAAAASGFSKRKAKSDDKSSRDSSPQAIMKRLNQDVVYSEEEEKKESALSDITEAIIQRLKAKEDESNKE